MAQGTLNAVQTLQAVIGLDVYTKAETNALLDLKADKSTTYTKTETDALLSEKANADSVYTKTETDALLDDKADADAVYTKTETDTLLSAKADKSTTLAGYGITDAYTKTETDNLLNGKANADDVYTKTEIDTKIPNTVGSATKPTYVNGGVLTECTYELNKTVPANAVFTDTIYTAGNGLNLSGTSFSAKAGTNVTVDGGGINVNGNGAVASADSGLINGGTAYTELRPTLDGTWVKNAQTTAINLQKLEGGIEYLYGLLSHQYDQLKKYINGNYYDYDTDADSKYVKTVPNGAMPYASLNEVGGKTLVFNQYMNPTFFVSSFTQGSLSVTNNGDGSYTISGTADTSLNKVLSSDPTTLVENHKYLLRGIPATANNSVFQRISNRYDYGNGVIFTAISGQTITGGYRFGISATNKNVGTKTFTPQLFDLTLLYGAGNEPTTVEEFTAQFPARYYQYSQGQLMSAGVTEVESVGINIWDEQWEVGGYNTTTGDKNTSTNQIRCANAIPVLPSTQYYALITYPTVVPGFGVILYYDVNGNHLSNQNVSSKGASFTTPSNAYYVRFFLSSLYGTTYNNDICINLSNASTNGNYYPYNGHTYPVPASIQALTGYGWSAGSVYNYIDYERKVFVKCVDKVVMDGVTTGRKVTNGWGGDSVFWTQGLPFDRSNMRYQKVVSDKFVPTNLGESLMPPMTFIGGSGSLVTVSFSFPTTITTVADANQWFADNNTTIYYALDTPQEIDISAYLTDDNLIEVEPNGTLTFENQHGDDYRIEVPSSETYMVDLQASL